MATQDSTTETLEIIRLLDEIVRAFTDGFTRPDHRIAVYERYLELRKTHDVRLVGRLIVIAGRGPRDRDPIRPFKSRTKALTVRAKAIRGDESRDSLPYCVQ
jgi:hypothetical protein